MKYFNNLFSPIAYFSQKQPLKLAIKDETTGYTYSELENSSNYLSRFLVDNGVKKGDIVGIHMERSANAFVAMVSILKVGAVYLPFDIQNPQERTYFILNEANPTYIICDSDNKFNHPKAILFESVMAEYNGKSVENYPIDVSKDDAAYVIYTSGSTGKPKGTLVTHKNVLVTVTDELMDLNSQDVFLNVSSLAFDGSVYPIWASPLYGGTLVCPSYKTCIDPNLLKELIQKEKATYSLFPTSFFDAMVYTDPSIFNNMRYIMVGGEVFKPSVVEKWFHHKAINKPVVLNIYGPTETTIVSTAYAIKEQDTKIVPIGKATNGKILYILNENLEKVSEGNVGELYIGGNGLAKGYFNQPEMTEERFIKNPYVAFDNSPRLYKTGDLVKQLPCGNILFVSRADFQVKIKSFRVELGEIENAIMQHPLIQEVAVIAKDHPVLNKRLISYYTTKEQKQLSKNDLQKFLASKLPDYMVPDFYKQLDKFKITINGKIDKKELQSLDFPTQTYEREIVPAKTATEKLLVSIWAEAFHIPETAISIHDNFFQLGGFSVLAIKVTAQLSKTLGHNIPVSQLFKVSILRDFAKYLDETKPIASEFSLLKAQNDNSYSYSYSQNDNLHFSHLQDNNEQILVKPMSTQLGFYYNELRGRKATLPTMLEIFGSIDVQKFISAVKLTIAKHQSLHSYYKVVDNDVFLTSINSMPNVDYIEGSNIEDIKAQFANCSLDLNKESYAKFLLVKVNENKYNFFFVFHHAFYDGLSLSVFLKDMNEFYIHPNAQLVEKRKYDYLDFVYSHKLYEQTNQYKEKLNFWRDYLEGADKYLNIPTDFPRQEQETFSGKIVTSLITNEQLKEVEYFARNNGSSIFNIFISSFMVFLNKLTGQIDITSGITTSGRYDYNLDSMVGNFVNSLPMRVQLNEDMNFYELIKGVHLNNADIQQHQEVCLPSIYEMLGIKADLGRQAFVQVMYAFEKGVEVDGSMCGHESTTTLLFNNISLCDLAILCFERKDGMELRFVYNAGLFLESTIKNWIDCYLNIMNNLIKNPSELIKNIPFITEKQKADLMCIGTGELLTRSEEIKESLVDCFYDAVKKYPHYAAVSENGKTLTYFEIDELSNKLADFLLSRKVKEHDIVGICFERSANAIISILAILKIGAAYVPLDPKNPAQRIHTIIQEVKAKLVLTNTEYESLIPERFRFNIDHVEYSDIEASFIKNIKINPKSLSHIQFTSGTTGKPKGIILEQQTLVRTILLREGLLAYIQPGDKLNHSTNLAFDASLLEIWGALLLGGHLVVISHEDVLDLQKFKDIVCSEKIAHLHLTSAVFNQACREIPEIFANAKSVQAGGEAMSPQAIKNLQALGINQNLKIINAYGPSETAIYCTAYEFTPSSFALEQVPIGRPTKNVNIYLLNENKELCLPGAVGELYISSDRMARGYFNNDTLTANVFVDNPFIVHTKMYKSGDLARFREDGLLEIIGRSDNQVKIRGLRIELGEIDTSIQSIQGINECITVKFSDATIGDYLVSYYTTLQDLKVTPEFIKETLRKKIPEYMIPNFVIQMDQMPKTNNGKVDKKQFPLPSLELMENVHEKVLPQSEIEKKCAVVWAELLRIPVEAISIEKSFFDYGGHSLMITKLIKKLEKIDIHVSLRDFITRPTIKAIAESIENSHVGNLDLDTLIAKDSKLYEIAQPLPNMNPNIFKPKYSLVTGVTGFLGAFIVDELVANGDSTIYCLVRAPSQEIAYGKVEQSFKYHKLNHLCPLLRSRILVLNADFSLKNFDLPEEVYLDLSQKIDAIYHSGAYVNHLLPYENLRKANVGSVQKFLKFACTEKNKGFYFVSTISAAGNYDEDSEIIVQGENEILQYKSQIGNGYALSKFVAEQLIYSAKKRGIRTQIFRPGNITGDTKHGTSRPSLNHVLALAKGCVQMGIAPTKMFSVDLTPVDIVARSVVKLSQSDISQYIFNLSSPFKIEWLDYMQEMSSGKIKFVKNSVWKTELEKIEEENSLYPFKSFYLGGDSHEIPEIIVEKNSTLKCLEAENISYPSDVYTLSKLYVSFLKEIAFL